jgi:hypothetical protein
MVVGMMMVLSSPFILASQNSVIQLRDASRFLDVDRSMDKVEQTAVQLNHSSYPARRVIDFQTPRGVEEIHNPVLSDSSALVFEINARGETVNRSIILDLELNLVNSSELSEEGIHEVSLRRTNDKINMSVIS